MMGQMAGMVAVMFSLEVWGVWINHFLTFLVILAASGKLVDRFCFDNFLPSSFLYDHPCFDISCSGYHCAGH